MDFESGAYYGKKACLTMTSDGRGKKRQTRREIERSSRWERDEEQMEDHCGKSC